MAKRVKMDDGGSREMVDRFVEAQRTHDNRRRNATEEKPFRGEREGRELNSRAYIFASRSFKRTTSNLISAPKGPLKHCHHDGNGRSHDGESAAVRGPRLPGVPRMRRFSPTRIFPCGSKVFISSASHAGDGIDRTRRSVDDVW